MGMVSRPWTTYDRSRSEQGGHGATNGTTDTVKGVDIEGFIDSDDKLESSGQVGSDGSDGTDTNQAEEAQCKLKRFERHWT
jgi:hypothetical protein